MTRNKSQICAKEYTTATLFYTFTFHYKIWEEIELDSHGWYGKLGVIAFF